MTDCVILKGYSKDGEIYAISKKYGSGETETRFICEVEGTAEIKAEYERQKNVCNHKRKKNRLCCWKNN